MSEMSMFVVARYWLNVILSSELEIIHSQTNNCTFIQVEYNIYLYQCGIILIRYLHELVTRLVVTLMFSYK